MNRFNAMLGFLFFLCAAAPAQDTRVILLGTGNPNPDPQRMGPAVAVVSGDHAYLVDCGPGVVRRAVQAGIGIGQLTRLFVTHLHSDHTAGYPDVILTPPNAGRHSPLEVWGPPGLRAMTDHIVEAWREDLQIRQTEQPGRQGGFAVEAHEIVPGEIYRDDAMRVVAFAVPHGAWKHAFGYRFEAKDRTIVISGDTSYSESLMRAAKGCDILVHEVYSQKGWEGLSPERQKYAAEYHTSAVDVGRIAARVQPLRRSEEFARDCFPEITQARFRAPASELSARDKG